MTLDARTIPSPLLEQDGRELTLWEWLLVLRARWPIILVITVVVGAAAVAMAYFIQPVYRADVLLSPSSNQSPGSSALSRLAEQLGPIAGVTGGFDSNQGLADKEVSLATLSSRWLAEGFVRERDLLPILFPDRWDPVHKRWRMRNGRPRTPTMDDAMKLFARIRTVKEDRRTGLVTLSIEWTDYRLVADWANDLVARVNEFLRRRAIAEAQRSISFLEGELSKTSVVERQQIIYRLIESKTSDIMMANARKEYAFLVVDPAVTPEPNNYVRPRRLMIAATGLALGLVLGIFYVGIRWNLLERSSSGARRSPSAEAAA